MAGPGVSMYQIAVILTVAVHVGFLCYVVAGGFLALRWRRSLWLHLAAVTWGILIVTAHLDCPLTWLESWARAKAGMAALPPEGFVAHYLTGVIYPVGWLGATEVAVLVVVAASWALYVWAGRRHATGSADRTR